jgi:hypothetical protein
MKFLLLVGLSSCLSGCALTLEMMAISGLSYLATGKSLSDNAFSVVTNKDCALHRIIMNQDICVENERTPNDKNIEYLLADSEITDTKESEVMIAASTIELSAALPSDVVASLPSVNISDFAVATEVTKALSTAIPTALPTEYSSAQIFAVVGSFNNYQYAQTRNKKYLSFNPKIITNQAHSSTKYRVVVGPVKRSDFISELPIMVGAETQLPWEIELCVDDMSPPPCNNTYARNIDEQQGANWIEAPIVSDTQILK